MTDDDARKQRELFATVSDQVTQAVLTFAANLPELPGTAVAEIFAGCTLGLFARYLEPRAVVARWYEIGAEYEAKAVNPSGRTN